jgi:hypothetical protein
LKPSENKAGEKANLNQMFEKKVKKINLLIQTRSLDKDQKGAQPQKIHSKKKEYSR